MDNSLPQILAFFGTDDGLVQEEALKWYSRLTEGTDDFGHDVLRGQVENIEGALRVIHEAHSSLLTPSFFGGRKVIWLKACSFLGDNALSKSADVQEALEELLNSLCGELPSDVFFLLSAGDMDKRRSFFKRFSKVAHILEFNKPDITKNGWQIQVAHLVQIAAQERQLSFESEALELFINRVSESSRQIFSELDKLKIYLQDRRTINAEDIRLLVPLTRTGAIFELGKAIEQGNAPLAFALLEQQLSAEDKAISIIRAAIIPTMRSLYLASLIASSYSLPLHKYQAFQNALQELPAEGKLLIPKKKDGSFITYPLFLSMQQLKNFSSSWLKKALIACFEADKALVTSSLDSVLVLQRLIVQLTDKRARLRP